MKRRDSAPVTVEPGRRGVGQRLGDQTSVMMSDEMANILRIMKANSGRFVGDLLREAAELGMPKMEGYKEAKAEYDGGRRIAKPPGTGGTPREDREAAGSGEVSQRAA